MVKTEKNILKLDPRATAVELDGKPGLRLNDDIRLAADNAQAAILRALLTGAKPIDSLEALLRRKCLRREGDAFAALALADFILRFGDFLLEA